MPRRNSAVKNKFFESPGLVDLHFHGAFGIDLMNAEATKLNKLSLKLARSGIAAFCPTTISARPSTLLHTVGRLGSWIHSDSAPGAKPLGIHLEGPFLSPDCTGAHPEHSIRQLSWPELDGLWEASLGTIKILTIAPETLNARSLSRLCAWARPHGVVLSLGHSSASETQAQAAFKAGFSGITHAWNALPFHHRDPGALGAALGKDNVHVELICDGIHVNQTVLRWTRRLHRADKICFVSDCAPAGGTRSGWHSFGKMRVRFDKGTSRLPSGKLAGGGKTLTDAYSSWISAEARATDVSAEQILRESIIHVTEAPLVAIGIPRSSWPTGDGIRWRFSGDEVRADIVTS